MIKFITPVDGDMLSNAAGTEKNDSLEIEVIVAADSTSNISINGVNASFVNGNFVAKVCLDGYHNTLTAKCECGAEEKIVVYWLKNAANKFSLSLDDNIWAFADINKNKDTYHSIFDNKYFNVYKQAHDLYGTKVRMNIFYQIDNQCGLDLYGPFNLSMMTDKFKDEFKANSNWLHLAFHAAQEFPDDPYTKSNYAQMKSDYQSVIREIKRFAGEEVIEYTTTNHWCSGNHEVIQAERSQGIKALMGYLQFNENDQPMVSYYLDHKQIENANVYGFWKDHSEDMIFGKIDLVLNMFDAPTAIKLLDKAKADHPKKGFIEFMIHEQYFYPTYMAYKPDYTERVLSACRWCRDNGYEPAFVSDIVFE